MSISTTLDQLKSTLSTPRALRLYAEARARREAFAPYETIDAALAAVARGAAASIAERDAIFATIVTELQESPEPFWRSVLLVTFTPMLVQLRSKFRRPSKSDPDGAELDQSVLCAFLETASSLKFRTFVVRNLWLLTRAKLFAERSRERRAPRLHEFDEETHPCKPFRFEVQQRAAADEVIRIIEEEGGEELRELVLMDSEGEDSVKEFVERAYAKCDAQTQARAAKRLRRARLEVFAKLRVRAARHERTRARAA